MDKANVIDGWGWQFVSQWLHLPVLSTKGGG